MEQPSCEPGGPSGECSKIAPFIFCQWSSTCGRGSNFAPSPLQPPDPPVYYSSWVYNVVSVRYGCWGGKCWEDHYWPLAGCRIQPIVCTWEWPWHKKAFRSPGFYARVLCLVESPVGYFLLPLNSNTFNAQVKTHIQYSSHGRCIQVANSIQILFKIYL